MLPPLTGLFLGAGASYEVGMPLVWDLTSEVTAWLTPDKLRWLNASWRDQGGGHPDAVIEDFCEILTRPDLHYESMLGYLETQFRRPGNRAVQHEYHALYSWVVDLVSRLLYRRHTQGLAYIEQRLPRLDGIAHLAASNQPLWIFSLNHDLIVECLAVRHGLGVNSGFSPEVVTLPRRDATGAKIGELRAEVLTGELLKTSGMQFLEPGASGINLLKIHGALDIFTFRNGEDLLKFIPTDPTVPGVIETLRAANEDLLFAAPGFPAGTVKTTNEINYADDEGEMQFLRRSLLAGAFKFDPHRDQVLPRRLLDLFRANLNHVSTLLCVGYGFGDIHINQVLRSWLEFTAERRIEIVGPGVKDIPPFLLHLAPQVTLVDSTATDDLDRRAGITRTRMESIEKRLDARARKVGGERMQDELATFIREHAEYVAREAGAMAASLRMRDGDIDLEALGVSPEEFARQHPIGGFGSTEDLLEAFLDGRRFTPEAPGPSHVATAAYFRWLSRGAGHGGDREDWLEAEQLLTGR